jgi:hypothetical protein
MPEPLVPVDGSTPAAPVVSPPMTPTPMPNGVNPAQVPNQALDTSGLIASYEQRLNSLMSQKDKAVNERNIAISQLTENQKSLTDLQGQTQGSITAAANAAQQAIERTKQLESELIQAKALIVKYSALLKRPHLAAYDQLIPLEADETKMNAALDQLEGIRLRDLEQYAKQNPTAPVPAPTPQTPQDILQNLYGQRANMNPAIFQNQQPIPSSSPASMNPAGGVSTTQTVQSFFDEANRIGTKQAFDDAVQKAALFAKNTYSS